MLYQQFFLWNRSIQPLKKYLNQRQKRWYVHT